MGAASEKYKAMVEAVNAQTSRLVGEQAEDDLWTGARAERFRSDPRRQPEPLLQGILEHVRPDDVVVDVGGGAGRMGLPLALHSRELINVDPSGGMKHVFESVAGQAEIKNARYVQSYWLDEHGISGDLTLVVHVTYFIADIVPFIEKLSIASKRRVMLIVNAEPPPNVNADIFSAVYGEALELLPGYRELLPVLSDMGLLPEVRIYEGEPVSFMRTFATRQEMIEASSTAATLPMAHRDRILQTLESDFDELFEPVERGFRRRHQPDTRQILITWETAGMGG